MAKATTFEAPTFKVVIPARYGSTRLPAKAVLDIAGRPMIQWVIDAALRSGADQVLVATDDERVMQAAVHGNPPTPVGVMTSAAHPSGTDRIAEVARMLEWDDQMIVVNVQGDEPQLPPVLVDQVAKLLADHPDADIATLATPIESVEEFLNPNCVKVVTDDRGYAAYFSRAPIPWSRDTAPSGLVSQSSFDGGRRHLGIYAYRVAALRRMVELSPSSLELTEKLEQLRALQAGMRIVVANAVIVPGTGVDTPADLERARVSLKSSS